MQQTNSHEEQVGVMPMQKRREVVKFTPNVPVEVALKFAGQNTIVSTRYGERVLYTLTDDRVMFVDLEVAQKIDELGVNAREKFCLCRHSGAKKPVWTVWLSPETERERAACEGRIERIEQMTLSGCQLEESTTLRGGEVGGGNSAGADASRPQLGSTS